MQDAYGLTSPEGRDWLIGVLKTNECVDVAFTKTDGTHRTMRCTLKEGVVVPYENKTDRTRAENTDVLRVWDLDKQAWRGFRLDSVREIVFDI